MEFEFMELKPEVAEKMRIQTGIAVPLRPEGVKSLSSQGGIDSEELALGILEFKKSNPTNNYFDRFLSMYIFDIGQNYFSAADFEKALLSFQEAFKLDLTNFDALLKIAFSCLYLARYSESLEAFNDLRNLLEPTQQVLAGAYLANLKLENYDDADEARVRAEDYFEDTTVFENIIEEFLLSEAEFEARTFSETV